MLSLVKTGSWIKYPRTLLVVHPVPISQTMSCASKKEPSVETEARKQYKDTCEGKKGPVKLKVRPKGTPIRLRTNPIWRAHRSALLGVCESKQTKHNNKHGLNQPARHRNANGDLVTKMLEAL